MKPAIFAVRIGLGCCLLLAMSLTASPLQSQDKPRRVTVPKRKTEKQVEKAPATPPKPSVEPGAVEIIFTDGSNLKLQLGDEKIALTTPHGKLLIAVADIQKIEFATRVSDDDAKRINAAIADLGDSEFSKREAASAQLLKLKEKAYPAIRRAAEQKDQEIARRAKDLIQQITAQVPAEQLAGRPKDVVYTADSIIAGRIEDTSLKAHTSQFGDVQVKLADVRILRPQTIQAQASDTNAGGGPGMFDPMVQQRMQMEMMQRQAQQQEFIRRRMRELQK